MTTASPPPHDEPIKAAKPGKRSSVRTLAFAAILLLALIGAALIAELSRGPSGRPPVGFSENAVAQGVGAPQADARLMTRFGATVDRVQFDWFRAEPQPGHYQLATYDAIYRADLRAGIRPLLDFAFAPSWASGVVGCDPTRTSCLFPPTPAHLADAARTAAMLAVRYPRLAGIEIWNEPNTPHFWPPRADAAAYTALLRSCYTAIKRANPSMLVAGGSISPSPAFNSRYLTLPSFLAGIYRNGGAHYMDATSVHLYPDPGDTTGVTALTALSEAEGVRQRFGDSQRPLWITEVGISTTGPRAVTELAQASVLVRLYNALRSHRDIRMILFHTLLEPPFSPTDPETGFGLVHDGFRLKPGYCVLSAAVGGSARC